MKRHILIDIEAIGLRPGCAITELGAVEFFPERRTIGKTFEAMVEPQRPFTADLATLEWHRDKGTWPRPFAECADLHPIGSALLAFCQWADGIGEVEAFWSWGATYDFPILTAAFDYSGVGEPWKYWQQRCARTVWQMAFDDRKHRPRPHRALLDAIAGATDLMQAMAVLAGDHGKESS